MKHLLLGAMLATVLVGCSDEHCETLEPRPFLVSTVHGCKIYDVYQCVETKANSGRLMTRTRYFMFTDCRETSLKWQCGKSCQTENGTK